MFLRATTTLKTMRSFKNPPSIPPPLFFTGDKKLSLKLALDPLQAGHELVQLLKRICKGNDCEIYIIGLGFGKKS